MILHVIKKIFYLFIISYLLIILNGCTSLTARTYRDEVIILPNNSYAKKDCKFIGKVYRENIHGISTLFSSDESLLQDDLNYLKKEGKKLNANVVVFNEHTIVQKPYWSASKNHSFYNEIIHNIKGEAFLCSKDEIDELYFKRISKNRNY